MKIRQLLFLFAFAFLNNAIQAQEETIVFGQQKCSSAKIFGWQRFFVSKNNAQSKIFVRKKFCQKFFLDGKEFS